MTRRDTRRGRARSRRSACPLGVRRVSWCAAAFGLARVVVLVVVGPGLRLRRAACVGWPPVSASARVRRLCRCRRLPRPPGPGAGVMPGPASPPLPPLRGGSPAALSARPGRWPGRAAWGARARRGVLGLARGANRARGARNGCLRRERSHPQTPTLGPETKQQQIPNPALFRCWPRAHETLAFRALYASHHHASEIRHNNSKNRISARNAHQRRAP